jgi:superfamily II DNA or RNA helicase
MSYEDFLANKGRSSPSKGIACEDLDYGMFPHQVDLTRWALRRGRAAIFADTGLGKSRMQIAWADRVHKETGRSVLILAPLAVAEQTIEEGQRIDVPITHVRDESDVRVGINITNYERLHRFDTSRFSGVVLDESSIIKHQSSKTFQQLICAFTETPFRLCATATPAPNDWTELGNHAEFLGICSRVEMLSEFFVHDAGETQVWRLKKHARAEFWRWVSSWGAMVKSPTDLMHDGSLFELPPLEMHQHVVESSGPLDGVLFESEAQTLMERRAARRRSLEARVRECAKIVNESRDTWIIWCDLNVEGDALTAAIHGAIQVSGSDDENEKTERMLAFAHGKFRVLVSKPSICGFGMNFQVANCQAFVGVTDSFESYYQAIRRSWRFGQRRPVHVHVFSSPAEGAVVANLKRKEIDAMKMADEVRQATLASVRESVLGSSRQTNAYAASAPMSIPCFL